MRILVYGAGAVGLGISSCLIKAGVSVDILARPNTVTVLKEKGLIRDGLFGEYWAKTNSFQAVTNLQECHASPYTHILVTTKSFDSEAAAVDIHNHNKIYSPKTKIILFQNGWGNAEIFTSHFPSSQIYNARVITGFYRPSPHHVTITVHADSIRIGSLFGNNLQPIEEICSVISQGGIPCELSDNIGKDLWTKMLYNCALNPLGAILRVPYGELSKKDYYRYFMNTIIHEVYKVMAMEGYCTYWPDANEYLKIFYAKLIPATASHRSSTLQDIEAGKKTEIDALNGIVVKIAKSHAIDIPANEMIYRIIKHIETSR